MMSKNILLVIDMQNDFIDGSLGTSEACQIVPRVVETIREAVTNGDTIIYTRDTHGSDYSQTQEGRRLPVMHCIRDTQGWQIRDEVFAASQGSAHVVDKPSFGYTGWEQVLQGAPDVITMIGLCTDICVASNALILKALYPETQIIVDASCCAGTTPDNHRAALQTMKSCQVEIR
ncbi:MAG: cysteine hydrolase [Clostridiales bacterium]|nr:cysteine hydrolase [Clostridiales bacterium]